MNDVATFFKDDSPSMPLSKAKALVRRRSGKRCEARVDEVCLGIAHHAHHIKRRAQGGKDHPDNLLDVCNPCHAWIHDHPDEARERGFLARSEPT